MLFDFLIMKPELEGPRAKNNLIQSLDFYESSHYKNREQLVWDSHGQAILRF